MYKEEQSTAYYSHEVLVSSGSERICRPKKSLLQGAHQEKFLDENETLTVVIT